MQNLVPLAGDQVRRLVGCVLLGFLTAFGARIEAADQLFSAPSRVSLHGAADAPPLGFKRTRAATINSSALRQLADRPESSAPSSPDLVLNLFAGKEFPVHITKTRRAASGAITYHGKVLNSIHSQVILVERDGIVAGSVFAHGYETTQIYYAGDGLHMIAEIDPATTPRCAGESLTNPGELPPGIVVPRSAGDGEVQIDVLVVYTTAARTGAGGTSAIENLIDLAIEESNETYLNSGINVALRLVHREEIAYTESGSASTDLTRLQGTADGQLDSVHALRTTYGADVTLLVTESMATYAGLAYVMSPVSTGFSSYAFGVIKRANLTGSYVVPHEVGHIMGCQHDRQNASSAGAYDYSYGYRFDVASDTYRTVMAYAPGIRIPYFSSPLVNYSGTPTGIASGATNSADNALTINNTAATVAAFSAESTFLQFNTSSTNLTESATTLSFTVTRTGATNATSTVTYNTSATTASPGTDYTAATGTLTFAPGETTKTVNVSVLNDSVVESNESFKLVLSNPTGAVLGILSSITITILDDDVGFAFTAASSSVSEAGTNVVLTVKRTGDSNGTNSVDYATVDLTATAGSDYTAASGTLTFGVGETNKTVSVTITDDAVLEGNETFRLVLSNPTGGAALAGQTNITVTILENDSAVSFSTNAIAALESAASVTLTLLRTGSTNDAASIDFYTIEGSATNGVDFSSTNGTVTFAAGVASKTITVPLLNDTDVDGDKTFTVGLTNGVGSTAGSISNTIVTLKDTDSIVQFTTNAVTVSETAGTLTLNVRRTGGVAGAATVAYATTNNTAVAGSDYTAATGSVSFAAGETNKTVVITLLNDTTIETNEVFGVRLSAPTGEASLGSTSSVDVTLLDNDSALSWATNAVTVAEGAGTVTLTILRTGTLTTTNTVAYKFVPGTATALDYAGTNGIVTFAPDSTNATVTVNITNDTVVEGTENFTVVLSSPTGGAFIQGTNTATVTITETDIGLSFASATYTVDEGATNVVLTVIQTGDTNSVATVDYATADLGAAAGSDYTATSGTLSFGPGTNSLTITVPISEDTTLETNETFRVVLSNPSGALLLTNSVATVKILENDSSIAFSTNAVSALESATNVVLTLLRTGGTNYPVTIDYLTVEGTATNGVDFTSTNGTVTFAAGVASKTITVPLLNDTDVDGDKSFTVALTNGVGTVIGTYSNLVATLRDTDSVVQFTTNAVSVSETAGTVTLNLTRSGGVAAAATVGYATTNNTALAGSDYTAATGTVSFAAGETNKTVVITILNDTTIETNEVFGVRLSAPTGEATIGSTSSVDVTLLDNDSALSWSTNALTVAESAGTVTLTILRTGTLSTTNTVAYKFVPGTATASDFAGTNGIVTFAPDSTNATVTVNITNDTVVEGTESFTVVLSSPTGGAFIQGTNTATITITETDIGLSFASATYTVDEGATNVVLTVIQTGDTNSVATVDYATADLGATAGSDYTATSGTLSFGPGTNSLTITVPITEDSTLETNETFRVVLSNPSGALLLTNSVATVKILENDSSIAFSTNAISALESATNVVLTLLRTGGTNYPVTIDYLTVEGTATNGVDFTSTNGTVTFAAGVASKTITVPLLNDTDVDGDKSFTVVLTNGVGSVIGSISNAIVTLKDTDSVVQFTTNAVSISEAAGTVTLNVRRTGGVAGAATVAYATTNNTALAGSDYTAATGTVSFAAGETNKTVVITLLNDTTIETNEVFGVRLSAPTGEAAVGSTSSVDVTLLDNDSALSWSTNAVTVAESAGAVTLTILRTGTLSTTNTVAYKFVPGTATATDFAGTNGLVTFAPDSTNATVTVNITNDTVVEGAESFTVVLSSPTGGAFIQGTNTATITITETDIGLSFASATYTVDEGATNVVLTVIQTGDTNSVATVDYATADLGATAGSDYTATSGTLSFGPGTNSLTITVPITEDTTLETNETFRVVLSNPSGALLLTNSVATVKILENDSSIAFSTNTISALESATNVVLTLLRTGGTNYSVTIDYLTVEGTATNGVDFVSTNGTVTFAAGVASKTVTVPLLNDTDVDGDKSFTVALTNGVGSVVGAVSNAIVTLKDTDSIVQFATNAVSVSEAVGTVSLSVTRTGGVAGAATVAYATTNNTALAGSDYTAATGTVSFAAGETNKTVVITVLNDTTIETNEVFGVRLSAPTGEATVGGTSSVEVTLLDNDSALSWSTNAVTVAESAGTVTLTILRTGTLSTTNTVAYKFVPGTATATDFAGTNGIVTFAPNSTNATVTVNITNDTVVEGTESFTVVLSSPTGGAFIQGTNTANITITETDIGLSFASATYSVDEGATNVVLTVIQTGDTNSVATVDYATADLGATAGSDYTATSGTLSFGPGTNSLTITVPITDDTALETNETFRVVLSNASGALLLTNSVATVKILENDSSIAFSTNTISTLESATNVVLTLLRTGGTNYPVTIDYLTVEGTATNGVDFTSTNGTVTFAAGVASKTITVPLLNDTDVDGDKSFTVALTNGVGSVVGSISNAVVTLKDTDSVVQFTTNAISVSETAGTVTMNVRRTGGVAGAATVAYATTNNTALAGSDYTAATGTVSFAAGETNKTVVITVLNDTTIETNEVFGVRLSAPTGEATVGSTSSVDVTLLDNDSALSWSTNAVTVAETAGTVTLTILRTGTLTTTNTVAYKFVPGTATATDFAGTNGIVTFAPDSTNATVTVNITNDTVVEGTESFTVVLSSPTGGAFIQGTNTATITITETDIGLSFASATYTVDEGATNVVLTVIQTGDTNSVATVDYATADLGATAGSDYTATSGTLSFGPGTNSLTITVPITDDTALETNETFRVVLSNASGALLLTNSVATVKILENDSSIAFSTNTISALESATNVVLTLLRTGGTNYPVTIDYLTVEGTATNGVDFTSTNGTVTFAAGVASKTITVPLLNDTDVDGDKSFTVALTNGVGTVIGTYSNLVATLKDTDSVVQFITNAVTVSETAGTVTLNVRRTGGVAGAATVAYATTNSTALAGSDYTAATGTVSFAAGETNKTVVITVLNDTTIETNEVFGVRLSAPTGEATVGSTSSVDVTLLDNDSALSWSTNAVTVTENAGTVTLTILRTGTLSTTNTVAYKFVPGTATALDYAGTNGIVTFAPDSTNATVSVNITNDSVVEGTESFTVVLSSPTGGAFIQGTNTATITITETDIGLSFASATYSVDEGATNVVLTVIQTGDTNSVATVDYATADLGATAGSDYTATSGTLSFGPGTNSLTITVPITEDTTLETNETFRVVLSNPSGALLLTNSVATVKILENDSSIAFSTNAVSALESASTVTLTLLRTGGTNYPITVDYLTVEGTATNGVDFTSTNGTVTFAAGVASKTITVPLLNDTSIDGDKEFTVGLTNAVGSVLGALTNATVTLRDTDSLITLLTNAVSVSEAAGTTTLSVRRSGGLAGIATVQYATANGTATAGSDYTSKSGTLSFAAGETNKTVIIPILEDAVVDPAETFTFTLSNPTGEGTLGTAVTTFTIVDNDFNVGGVISEIASPVLSIAHMLIDENMVVTLEVEGPFGAALVLEYSEDLETWNPIANGVATEQRMIVTDTASKDRPSSFYRVRSPRETAVEGDVE